MGSIVGLELNNIMFTSTTIIQCSVFVFVVRLNILIKKINKSIDQSLSENQTTANRKYAKHKMNNPNTNKLAPVKHTKKHRKPNPK